MKLADEATAPDAMTRLMNSRRDTRRALAAAESTASEMLVKSAMLPPTRCDAGLTLVIC
jgi:hypothetical protein